MSGLCQHGVLGCVFCHPKPEPAAESVRWCCVDGEWTDACGDLERHVQVETPNWDTKVRCSCGAEFVSRCEFWKHGYEALSGAVQQVGWLIWETPDDWVAVDLAFEDLHHYPHSPLFTMQHNDGGES